MSNTSETAVVEKDPSTLGWWALLLVGIVISIILTVVLLKDRNAAEMHKGEGVAVAGPKGGH